jgi:hypothetical protein
MDTRAPDTNPAPACRVHQGAPGAAPPRGEKKVEKGVPLSRGACEKKFISNIRYLDKKQLTAHCIGTPS